VRLIIRVFYRAVILTILLGQLGCEIRQPLVEKRVMPVLSRLKTPQTVYLKQAGFGLVTVQAADPQGKSDIMAVIMQVVPVNETQTVFSDTLLDDGKNGDLIYNDGVFTGKIDAAFLENRSGSFTGSVSAVDLNGNNSTILNFLFEAVDAPGQAIPVISQPVHPDTLNLDEMQDVMFTLRAEDENGAATLDSVWFDLYPFLSTKVAFHGSMHDDGNQGDNLAADSIYTFKDDLTKASLGCGLYLIRFQAVDDKGLKSNSLVSRIYLDIPDGPPVLSQLSAPDTVSRIDAKPFVLSVLARDPLGADDIKRVFFNVTVPSGDGAQGNPFAMFDNGSNGDKVKNDGIYSLTVTLDINNKKGRYRFDFIAEDLAGSFSDTLSHYITVIN